MPRSSPFTIALSSPEEAELRRRAGKYTLPYFQVQRAKMILYAAEGTDASLLTSIATRRSKGSSAEPNNSPPLRGFVPAPIQPFSVCSWRRECGSTKPFIWTGRMLTSIPESFTSGGRSLENHATCRFIPPPYTLWKNTLRSGTASFLHHQLRRSLSPSAVAGSPSGSRDTPSPSYPNKSASAYRPRVMVAVPGCMTCVIDLPPVP